MTGRVLPVARAAGFRAGLILCAALAGAAPGWSDDLETVETLRRRAHAEGQEAIGALESALSSSSQVVRSGAADILADLGGPRVERIFIQALASPDAEMRQIAASGLGRVAEGDEAVRSVRAAARDSNPLVRWSAVLALGRLADRGAEDLLRGIAAGDPYRAPGGGYPVREAAQQVLAMLPAAVRWHGALEPALEIAARQGRPVLAFFESPDDPWSVKMRNALANPGVLKALQPWVCARLTVRPGSVLASDFEIRGVPTCLLLAPDGREIERWPGYLRPETIETRLRQVASGGAASEIRNLAESRRDDPDLQWKAAVSFLEEGREDRAILYLERIPTADPLNAVGVTDDALFALGYSHGKLGRHEDAIRYLEQLVRLHPEFERTGEAWYCLGLSQLARGNRAAAEAAWRQAVSAGDAEVRSRVEAVRRDLRRAATGAVPRGGR